MSFDGLMMHHLTNEYHHALNHHRVDKMMYLNHDVFVFELYFQKERKLFYIDLHANDNRMYYTPHKEIQTDLHPSLSMFKKTLIRSQIKSIKQYQTDRVCIITFESYDAFQGKIYYDLIIEMMGKHANMILLKDGIIIEAYKKMVSEKTRSIAYHIPFVFFPSHKKQLHAFDINDCNVNDLSSQYEGMSKDLAIKVATEQMAPLEIPLKPSMKGNKRFSYEVEGCISFSSMNMMMQITQQHEVSDTLLSQLIKKREQKLSKLQEDLALHQSHLNDYLIAEKLYSYENPKANIHRIDDLVLDINLSVHEHAQHFLNTYNKAKRALPHIQKQIQETKDELIFLKQLLFDLSEKNILYEEVLAILYAHKFIYKKIILKKQKSMKAIEVTVDGYLIFIGKHATMNAYVTHELARPNDYFMHVKDAPGGHVICRAPKESVAFNDALKYAAYFSKLKHAGKIEVMVALKKDVKKIPGMHGSMVSVKHYESYVVELDHEFVKLCESL